LAVAESRCGAAVLLAATDLSRAGAWVVKKPMDQIVMAGESFFDFQFKDHAGHLFRFYLDQTRSLRVRLIESQAGIQIICTQ
jgi:hypothetical protein